MAKRKKIASSGPDLFSMPEAEVEIVPHVPLPNEGKPVCETPENYSAKQSENIPAPVEKTEKREIVPEVNIRLGVKLRSGDHLFIGDECVIPDQEYLNSIVKGVDISETFILEKFTPWKWCESQVLVIAYQKNDPTKKTIGIGEKGIDANWFKKVTA